MVRFLSVVLATVFLFSSTITAQESTAASAFVSSDKYFSFALNIPKDEDNSLYFSLQGTDSTWIAVGLGSDNMAGALVFMAYADEGGKNVTLSPRLSHGHVEPAYTSSVTLEVLPGTGIINGTMKVNAKCGNCRSWKGGSLSPEDKEGKFIFASGPGGSLKSNSLSAGVKRHASYGSFVMDLTRAVGNASVPDQIQTNTIGSAETQNKGDRRDLTGPAHAILMIGTFIGLLPLGIMVLRVFKSPKWHGVLQLGSLVIALTGMSLGIWMGTKYNRTKNFNSPHQIIGIIVIVGMIGQGFLGLLHHRSYKQTSLPTKFAPVHVWLGRFVILLGIINGFLGFPLALNPKYDLALLSAVLFVLIVFGPFTFWRYRRNMQKQKLASPIVGNEGYQSQPWVTSQGQSTSDIHLGQMSHPPTYQGRSPMQSRQFV